jgi:hypothetical protein
MVLAVGTEHILSPSQPHSCSSSLCKSFLSSAACSTAFNLRELPAVIIYTKIYINSLISKALSTGICHAYSLIIRLWVVATSFVVVDGGGKVPACSPD